MSSSLIVPDELNNEPISPATQPLPNDATFPRVVKVASDISPLEVDQANLAVRASHYLIVDPNMLFDIRQAAYHEAKVVPEIVNDANFLGCVEIVKNGEKRQIFFRAIAVTFNPDAKIPKKEKCDIVHCWSCNITTFEKIKENYAADIYNKSELSTADREVFDAFFELSVNDVGLDIKMGDDNVPPAGFTISKDFGQIDKSTNTLGKRRVGETTKRKLAIDELTARLEHVEKMAKWVDRVVETKTGQISVFLNLKNPDGKQMIVSADPLD